jgi:beta-N-acetylhexosaminidase
MPPEIARSLRAPPFNLDDDAVAWVARTLAALTPDERIGQLFTLRSHGFDPAEAAMLRDFAPGGITRFFGTDAAAEVAELDALRMAARVPYLVSADLEGSRMSLPFGVEVPNPLALAAVDDVQASRGIAALMAREAQAVGINWSFTPVLDINHAFRSAIVATRGFGSDVDRIARHALAQIEGFQAHGVAATAKHWPGEGYDDRDQHLVTTINPLTMAEWEATFGRLYRAAIGAGVMAVMSAHIALPAFAAQHGAAGLDLYRPASVSPILNETLLRGHLGFNGLIVSDATPMAGLTGWAPRDVHLPEIIANGCDMILFSVDPWRDRAIIAAAVADGRISRDRHDAALARILGLKAALGLHRGVRPADLSGLGLADDRARADAVTARAPTLVKDTQGTLPLSPDRHRRVLVLTTGIVSPAQGAFPFVLPDLMRAEGFDVTVHDPATGWPDPRAHDLVLYLMGEETLLTRGRIHLDWAAITGHFIPAMDRSWFDVPNVLVSFGWPYYLYDAPRMPCVVNAYATMDGMQRAVLDCLTGRAPFLGQSPVDPFCGLPDARF